MRRARQAKAAAALAIATPTLFSARVPAKDGGLSLGEAVSYPPRIATIPVVCGTPNNRVETIFIVVDDLAAAPESAIAPLMKDGDMDAFIRGYAKQCRFLSGEEAQQAFSLLDSPLGCFTHVMITPAFTALLSVDAACGIASTLVVMGSATQAEVACIAEVLEYHGPREYEDGTGFEISGLEEAVPACASHVSSLPSGYPKVFFKYATAMKVPSDDTSAPPSAAQCTVAYVNKAVGVRFIVRSGCSVYTHRLTDETRLDYEDPLHDAALSIQRIDIPANWVDDNERFIRGVVLECTTRSADGSYGTKVEAHTFAGRRAVAFDEEGEAPDGQPRWCRSFVCPVGAPRGKDHQALLVRWEGAAGPSAAAHLAEFLDTFFLL